MKKDKPLKFNEESTLVVTEIVGQEQVQDIFTGKIFMRNKLKKYVATGEVNLGSAKEPNTKIHSIKYDVPKRIGIGK